MDSLGMYQLEGAQAPAQLLICQRKSEQLKRVHCETMYETYISLIFMVNV